jgi:hypothetical protein
LRIALVFSWQQCVDDLAGVVVSKAAQNGVHTFPDVDNMRLIRQPELLESYTDFLAVPAGSAAAEGLCNNWSLSTASNGRRACIGAMNS